ncbi:helix-turn-helix transcriptional regulator [Aquipuribacter hungaricus]|uniref:Helix-turn-helix transcriptional regulator n=1 Tax=Aquipuribacter hungaricus TaxID=545624 RepID=A0ABV7WBA1_9MICO
MSLEEPAPLWSTEQLADYLGVAVPTVHALRRRGEAPPAYRVGRVLRFVPAEVDTWLHQLQDDMTDGGPAVEGTQVPTCSGEINRGTGRLDNEERQD